MNKVYFSSVNFPHSTRKGFTLIELLVVISIIAVLTTLLMANFVGIRQRGRDGQRKSNLYSIQSALELYRADNFNYPDTESFPECGKPLEAGGNPPSVYMQKVPCDPLDDTDYEYESEDGATYTLIGCLENQNDADADETKAQGKCNSTPASFTLRNP